MTDTTTSATARLRALQQSDGGFVMVALDQRESLRTMLADGADPADIGDQQLRDFKRVGIEELSPHASAMLLDRLYAVEGRRPEILAEGCALILAVDRLIQPVGEEVVTTELDEAMTPDYIDAVDAQALKMLVLWRADESAAQRAELTGAFLELCAETGRPGIVEGIVRPPSGRDWEAAEERHEAVHGAAIELSSLGADLYKGQVPGYVPGDVSSVTEWSRRLSHALACPWVVLSNGVRAEDFAGAVEAACDGGASGFLAGRAIWADTVNTTSLRDELRARSVPRLQQLSGEVARRVTRR